MKLCTDIFAEVEYNAIPLGQRTFPDQFVGHIIQGNCTEVMHQIPDNSIALVVTSPPYFVEKQYERDWTFEHYSRLMSNAFTEIAHVLKPGGYLVINFGDYFNRDRFYVADVPSVYPASVNFFQWGRSAGLDLQATRIWRKKFARMSIPFVCNDHPRPVFDYEHIWTFRKPDGTGTEFVNDRKKSQRGVLGDGWGASAQLSDHEAAFPIELPLWAIDVYSKEANDIVLDPFAGLGTTLLAAMERGRQFIGIELSSEHCNQAYCRIRGR